MSWLKKNKFLILIIILFLLLNNLPYLAGIYKSINNPNINYNGSPIVNQGDYFVYLSYIEQGKSSLFIKNPYDIASTQGVLLAPLWSAIGQVAKLTGNIAAYHIFRLLFGLAFIFILWWWIKKIFTLQTNRLLALAVVLFANGSGVFFLGLNISSDISPINLWVSEANTFLNLYQGPLFSFSQVAILSVLALFVTAYQKNKIGLMPWMFALAILLFISHPYELIIINLLLSTWTLLIYKKDKNKKIFINLLWLYSASVLAGVYFLWLFTNPAMANYRSQNITTSGNILEYIFGFGLLTILSWLGIYIAYKKNLAKNIYLKLFIIWAILGWAMVYLPFDFNRRLSNGWHIPLAILSTIAIIYLYKKSPAWLSGILLSLLAIGLLFDTIYHIILYTDQTWKNSRQAMVYTSQTRQNIYDIIGDKMAGQTILTREVEGNRLPAYVNTVVYMGHNIQTPNARQKNLEVKNVWTSQQNISNWLTEHNIDYIFASRQYIPEIDNIKWLAHEPYINPIIDQKDFIFYQFITQ